MKTSWSAALVPFCCTGLVTAVAAVPATALAQGVPSCDLVAPSILTDETRVVEVEVDGTAQQGCLYHVRIPDDAYASRSFKLLVPESFADNVDAPRMVLDFHGYGSSKANQMGASCWKEKAFAAGFVVAYPNGTGVPASFSAGDYCCDLSLGLQRDDVQFSRDVVAEIETILGDDAGYAVDPGGWKRYASGLSNGGAMAHELACEANDLFDGVAPVSQTYSKRPGNSCLEPGETPIPVIDFRALGDETIPYGGGKSVLTLKTTSWLSADESRQAWAEALGCDSTPPSAEKYEGLTRCERLHGCAAEFVQCSIDGKHRAYSFAEETGLNICDAAWEFFGEQSSHKLPR